MAIEIADLVTKFSGDTRDADAAFRHIESRAQSHVNKVNETLGRLRSISGFASGAAGGIAAALGVNAVGSIAEASAAIVNYSANLEQTRIAFDTLLKSSTAAELHLRELQRFATTTPFEFPELVQASRRFLNMGLTAQQVIPIMRAVGDAVAAAGGNSQTIERVTVAISQMSAKSKVSAEEINQLAENGIAGWEILSQQLGKSKAEVIKLAEQGRISSDVFLQAFQRFSDQNFGGAMEKQSRTFLGALSTIKDTLQQTANTSFEPLFSVISEISVRLSDEVQKSQSLGEQLSAVIKAASEIVGATISAAAYGLGKLYADQFVAAFTAEDIGSRLRAASNVATLGLSGVLLDVAKGLTEGIGLYEFESTAITKREASIKSLIPVLQQAAREEREKNKTVSESVIQLDNLKKSQADVEKQTKAVNDIFRSTARSFYDFGENSRQASITQQLLAAGITNVNEGLAAQAIQVASVIDAWNRYFDDTKKEAEGRFNLEQAYQQSVTSFNNSLKQLKFSFDFPNADGATLQVTNLRLAFTDLAAKVKGLQGKISDNGFIKLSKDIEDTEKKLGDLESSFNSFLGNKRVLNATEFIQPFINLRRQMQESFRDITIFEKGKTPIDEIFVSLERALNFLPGELDGFRRDFQRIANSKLSTDLLQPDITTSVNTLINYLSSEAIPKSLRLGTDQATKLSLALNSGVIAAIDLGNGIRNIQQAEGLNKFNQLSEQLTNTLNKDVEVTERAKLEKTLLGEAYKYLTEAQRAYLLGLAEEIDKQEEWSRSFAGKFDSFKKSVPTLGDGLEDSFINSLNAISTSLGQNLTDWRQGFSGMFKGIVGDFANMAREIAAYMIKLIIIQSLLKLFGGFLGGGAGGGTASGAPVGLGTGAITPPFAEGGLVRFADGGLNSLAMNDFSGLIRGAGTETSDSIPARLSNNEFVVRAKAVKHYGTRFMDAINSMRFPRIFEDDSIASFAEGGSVFADVSYVSGNEGLTDQPGTVFSNKDTLSILSGMKKSYQENQAFLNSLGGGENSYTFSPQSNLNSGNTNNNSSVVNNYNTYHINVSDSGPYRNRQASPSRRQLASQIISELAVHAKR